MRRWGPSGGGQVVRQIGECASPGECSASRTPIRCALDWWPVSDRESKLTAWFAEFAIRPLTGSWPGAPAAPHFSRVEDRPGPPRSGLDPTNQRRLAFQRDDSSDQYPRKGLNWQNKTERCVLPGHDLSGYPKFSLRCPLLYQPPHLISSRIMTSRVKRRMVSNHDIGLIKTR
jgi:hypothetical protein